MADQAGVPKPTTGGPYHWTTKDDWWFSCLNSTTNATTTTNAGGEAFVALSPDGTKYTLSHLSKRWVTQLHEQICTLDGIENPQPPFNGQCDHRRMTRKEYTLLPTRVEDRFGNWVTYTWSTDEFAKLLNITAKDGRTITLGYNSQGLVSTVSDGTRTWSYTYLADGSSLTTVTLPDTSKWQYAFVGLHVSQALGYSCADIGEPFNCYSPPPHAITGYGEVTHPSGAVIGFSFANHFKPTTDGLGQSGSYPLGLSSKTLSGPGLTPATWSFSYLPTRDEFKTACASQPGQVACPKTTSTTVVAPDSSVARSTFGIVWATNQGLLLSEQAGKMVSGAPIFSQTTAITYTDPAVTTNGFVVIQGTNPLGQDPALMVADYIYTTRRQPIQSRVTNLQAVDFKWQATAFDTFARPTTVTRFSVGNAAGDKTRTDTTSYLNDMAKWVVGLEDTVTYINGSDGPTAKVIRHTDYDATSRLPWKTYAFGALQGTLTYGADGNLSTITDPNGYTTTASNWYRGIPQLISFPATPGSPGSPATSISANVSPLGWISDVTDQLGSKNCYSYDAMGRISLINFTSEADSALCNATTWAPTNAAFVPVASAEYGLPAGHWRQTVYTGNGRTTTYYDARWQPVLTLAEDTSNALTRSFTVARYDTMGRQTFKSYPVATLTSVNDTLKGLRTTYDDSGRVVQVQQDSESVGGQTVLNTSTEYLSGFQTRVTNPRGKQTVTGYQVFDSPSTDAPLSISLPEGVWTTITRDVFGKPKSVSRSGIYAGNPLGVTRYYVYDTNERLCQTINPESGTSIVSYDAAGNPNWSAEGQAASGLTAASCAADRAATATGAKTFRSYDAMNRVTAVDTPGGTADVDTTYYADGKVNTLTAANPGGANVITTYGYNKRRLLVQEYSSQPGWYTWGVGYGYNANGHPSMLAYPNGLQVSYSPNALGQATQVGAYATGISYYPNGAIAQFTYGNGVVHTMTPNERGLPARSQDKNGSTAILDDSYVFDANGNVTNITDQAQAGITSRTMTYDGLDRLASAAAPGLWNAAAYTYDPIDNLRTATLGAAGYTYGYDGANRLVSLVRSGGSTYTYVTDARGNITYDGRQSYQFDAANRMSEVTGKESYRYDGLGRRVLSWRPNTPLSLFLYNQAGQVLYVEDGIHAQSTTNIYLGNTLLATRAVAYANGAVTELYQHTDALGSPVAVTNLNRQVVERTSYTPFGAPFNHPVEGVGYTGHVMDQQTGLTYMQQRYYDPAIGRFLSTDPAESEFNRYNYASNNPYRFVDPDGRQSARVDPNSRPEDRKKALDERKRREDAKRGLGMGGQRQPQVTRVVSPGGPLTSQQVIGGIGGATTVASAVNDGVAPKSDSFDRAATKSLGRGIRVTAGFGNAVEMVRGETARDKAHGAIMLGLVGIEAAFPPTTAVLAPIQYLDFAVQLTPAYTSKQGHGTFDGWTGVGLAAVDAQLSRPPHPMMRDAFE